MNFYQPSKKGRYRTIAVVSTVSISTDFMGESKANKANVDMKDTKRLITYSGEGAPTVVIRYIPARGIRIIDAGLGWPLEPVLEAVEGVAPVVVLHPRHGLVVAGSAASGRAVVRMLVAMGELDSAGEPVPP